MKVCPLLSDQARRLAGVRVSRPTAPDTTTRKDGDGALPPFFTMPTAPYEEHLLAAPDVCSNCLRVIREERVDPTRSGLGRDYEQTYQRRPDTTVIGYGPSDAVSDSKGVFCECGVEGHRERIWTAADVDRDRFRELLTAAVRTLVEKDVSLKRQETLAYALQRFDDGAGPDEAIATGVEAGIVANAASPSTQPAD